MVRGFGERVVEARGLEERPFPTLVRDTVGLAELGVGGSFFVAFFTFSPSITLKVRTFAGFTSSSISSSIRWTV